MEAKGRRAALTHPCILGLSGAGGSCGCHAADRALSTHIWCAHISTAGFVNRQLICLLGAPFLPRIWVQENRHFKATRFPVPFHCQHTPAGCLGGSPTTLCLTWPSEEQPGCIYGRAYLWLHRTPVSGGDRQHGTVSNTHDI